MIEPLTEMPPDTLGFRVTGEIERDDYAGVLAPALHAAVEQGALRTLYVIEDLDEIEPSALWEDAKLTFDVGLRHHSAWKRSAIVTDIEWLARATRLFLWMVPGEARLYPRAKLEAAKAWVAA